MDTFITIPVSPIAVRIGPLAISWYGIMIVLAMIGIVLFSAYDSKRYGLNREQVYELAVYAIIAGIIGARLVHVVDYWSYYSQRPLEIFGFEGFAVWGAILGAALATGLYGWYRKISFWRLGDLVAPGAVLGQAIGRLGCTLNGCCYGDPTDLPWAFMWTDPKSYAPPGIAVHPAQVYLLIWNLVVFAILLKLRRRLKPDGSLFLTYLSTYAIGDFLIRFVREGEVWVAGLLQAQIISLCILASAVSLMVVRMFRYRRRVNSRTTDSEQHQSNST
jgi:phosphatidylglycerol:prolipoprotein diacylglycerol transferase